MSAWIRWFEDISIRDVAIVGGKNASLGEMVRELGTLGVRVPPGFAVTAEAYRYFLEQAGIAERVNAVLEGIDGARENLVARSDSIRELIIGAALPDDLAAEIAAAYRELSGRSNEEATDVAVRSSATAEDLPTASFAGQQESYLNVRGERSLLDSVKKCFASLFTPRAIHYRADMGFEHQAVALSVGIQKMVRSDRASAGVNFTLDTETGHRGVVLLTSSWGLGENIVQGKVNPDQFYVHKETLKQGFKPLVWRKLGAKEYKLVYDETGHRQVRNLPTPESERDRFSLNDEDVLELARWSVLIEDHYGRVAGTDTPMDIEWAKDGNTGELYIVQARPETIHSRKGTPKIRFYTLKEEGIALSTGAAVGEGIATGNARVIRDPQQIYDFRPGEVLITESTDPDWEPIMRVASAIVTDRGGRTSHAAIVARELGIPAVVGTGNATIVVGHGDPVTVSCAEGEVGKVYAGKLTYDFEENDISTLRRPKTKIMVNVAQPEGAFRTAQLPVDGVGLARMEFIFAGWVRAHPLALMQHGDLPSRLQREIDRLTAGYDDKIEYFIDKLAQGIGVLAAAFWPNPVILRFSDFKTNEYGKLLGGERYEPKEENPMLGWRGASRYYHPNYKPAFLLEVAAVRRVRETFGLKNLKVMVPFCRTPEEGARVIATMREGGLERGRDGLEVYVMAEIPSNILLAKEFAEHFDGFSIGSNDLTQLILGVDRDSDLVAPLFDERSEAVQRACAMLLESAHAAGRPVGICGQAPSDYPEFASFLVRRGIESISLNPDAVIRTTLRVLETEAEM